MGFHTTDSQPGPARRPRLPRPLTVPCLLSGVGLATCRGVNAFILLATLTAAVAAGACDERQGNAGPAAPPPTGVKLASAHVTPIEDASEYLATIQSLSSTLIHPEVSGEITRIFVRSGDRVRGGTPLFEIDPRRQEATVSTQDAALAAQQSAARLARQDLDRARTLFAAGAISQQQLDQAQATYDSAQSQLAAQQARLQQERVTLQYYQVKAPGDGVVGDIPVRVGLHVTSDTTLTSIDRNQDLEVDVQVPLERAHDLRVGLPMRILDGQGNPLSDSRIFFVSPRVDSQTQSVLVKGRVPADTRVRSAQFVRARIVWRTVDGLTVPLLSVVRVNGQPFVFVAKEDGGRLVAEQRLVTLGDVVENDVTVKSGLAPNERVVVSGVQKLINGAPIRPA